MQIKNISFKSIDSTNTYAKNHYKHFDPKNLTCIIASEQTSGRGRFTRKWLSPPGKNLTATFYFSLPIDTKDTQHLAQLMSFSVAKVLASYGFCPKLKYPNDVLLSNKKVAGVLCELQQIKTTIHVFLGIGLNINMTKHELDQIDQEATSLAVEEHKSFSIEEIYQKIQKRFLKDLDVFKEKGFDPFSKEFIVRE